MADLFHSYGWLLFPLGWFVLCWATGPMMGPVLEGLGQTLVPAAAILMLTGLEVMVLTASARRLRPVWRSANRQVRR